MWFYERLWGLTDLLIKLMGRIICLKDILNSGLHMEKREDLINITVQSVQNGNIETLRQDREKRTLKNKIKKINIKHWKRQREKKMGVRKQEPQNSIINKSTGVSEPVLFGIFIVNKKRLDCSNYFNSRPHPLKIVS